MVKNTIVPDAWDDDWESQADKAESNTSSSKVDVEQEQKETKTTKAERLAKHAEANRRLWENAEVPETFHFLETRDTVPLKTEFKPTLKVLSRKPAPKIISKTDPITGLATMTSENDEDEEELRANQNPEEVRLRAQKEREEKQKRYDEVRARIMGTSTGTSSENTTPPNEVSKGRVRGRGSHRDEKSKSTPQSNFKELFDPNVDPGLLTSKRKVDIMRPAKLNSREDDQIIRTPKGPEGRSAGFGKQRG